MHQSIGNKLTRTPNGSFTNPERGQEQYEIKNYKIENNSYTYNDFNEKYIDSIFLSNNSNQSKCI